MGRFAAYVLGTLLGLLAVMASTAQAGDPIKSPYSDAEIIEALKPYNFRFLTSVDLAALPARYAKEAEKNPDFRYSEVSGWLHFDEGGRMFLYGQLSGAATGRECLPVLNLSGTMLSGYSTETAYTHTKTIAVFQDKFVRLVGNAEYMPGKDSGFGGGWTLYLPLSVPDKTGCGTQSRFITKEIYLGR